MRLQELMRAIESRTTYRFANSPASGAPWSKMVDVFLNDHLSYSDAPRSGYHEDYKPADVERAVAWIRMGDLLGNCRGSAILTELRRSAQRAIPAEHSPGWVVMSDGKAWFQESEPIDALISGKGGSAIRVHDDCTCLTYEH